MSRGLGVTASPGTSHIFPRPSACPRALAAGPGHPGAAAAAWPSAVVLKRQVASSPQFALVAPGPQLHPLTQILLSDCLNFRRCMRCLGQLLFHTCSSWRMQICQRHDFSFSSLSRSWGANSGARGMRL